MKRFKLAKDNHGKVRLLERANGNLIHYQDHLDKIAQLNDRINKLETARACVHNSLHTHLQHL